MCYNLAAIPSVDHTRGLLAAIGGTVPQFTDSSPQCRFNNRCPHAAPVCASVDPPLLTVGRAHEVACFGYVRGAEVGRPESEMPDVPKIATPQSAN